MPDIYEKTLDGQLKVTKTVSQEMTASYDINALIKQKEAIQNQWDRDNQQRQKEIDEVDLLISECKKLGINEAEVIDGSDIISR